MILAIILMYFFINVPYDFIIDEQKDSDEMTPRDFVFLFVEIFKPLIVPDAKKKQAKVSESTKKVAGKAASKKKKN